MFFSMFLIASPLFSSLAQIRAAGCLLVGLLVGLQARKPLFCLVLAPVSSVFLSGAPVSFSFRWFGHLIFFLVPRAAAGLIVPATAKNPRKYLAGKKRLLGRGRLPFRRCRFSLGGGYRFLSIGLFAF